MRRIMMMFAVCMLLSLMLCSSVPAQNEVPALDARIQRQLEWELEVARQKTPMLASLYSYVTDQMRITADQIYYSVPPVDAENLEYWRLVCNLNDTFVLLGLPTERPPVPCPCKQPIDDCVSCGGAPKCDPRTDPACNAKKEAYRACMIDAARCLGTNAIKKMIYAHCLERFWMYEEAGIEMDNE